MAFKMTPFQLAQPEASPAGGNYRNPKLVIDRSAEILTAGLQQGVNNFVDSYMEAKDGGASEKKETPKEKSKVDLDKTFKVKNDAFDTSKITANPLPTSTLPKIELVKPDSPNNFLGGIAAAVGSSLGNQASAGGDFDRAKWERMAQRGGFGGKLAQQVLAQNPVADPTQAAQAAQAAASVAPTAGMSGDPALAGAGVTNGGSGMTGFDPNQKFQITPVQMSYDPPTPANMKGDAKPVFNAAVQASAEAIYGSPKQRQQSVGTAFKK